MPHPASIALVALLSVTAAPPSPGADGAGAATPPAWSEPGSPPVADTVTALHGLPAVAEGTENPLLPRGALHLAMSAANLNVVGLHGSGPGSRLGSPFFPAALGVEDLPELADTQERFRDLIGPGSDWTLNLGSVRGRFHAQEQFAPVHIGYGLLDRVSVGVTLPFVRRRIHPLLRLAGEGATVGDNPSGTAAGDVNAFLSQSAAALVELQERVAAECEESSAVGVSWKDSTRCQEGQELLEQASGFVGALEAAYDEALVFPLRGTAGATQIAGRWENLRTEFAGWDVTAPEALPLAQAPLDDDTFASSFVHPVWGVDGFPRDRVDEFMELGDVEIHAVLGLLDRGERGEALRIRSSLVASVRLPTGAADSLQTLVPMAPPRGTSGAGLRLVTDLVSGERRFGLLTVLEGWWYGEAEATLMAPDPQRLIGEEAVDRLVVDWQPGSTLRVAVTPRFHVTPGISLGVGYHFDHRGDHSMSSIDGGPVAAPPEGLGSTLHRLQAELRYHGFDGPVARALPFPLELRFSYDGTVSGSGDLPLMERRIQVGARVLRGG